MSDTEAYLYRYSWDLEDLKSYPWSHHYIYQPEVLKYLQGVTKRCDLRKDMYFNIALTEAHWDDAASRWVVRTSTGMNFRARYLVSAFGPLSRHNFPDIPGIDIYCGKKYHTGAWPENVMLEGKRVVVVRKGHFDLVGHHLLSPSMRHAEENSSGSDIYDAEACLAIPQFCENHIHLDYANTAGKPRDNQSGTLFEAIEIWRDRKEAGLHRANEIKANALLAVRSCVGHGVGVIRLHADVTDPNLTALKVLLELKDEVKDWCEIQIVAFPQNRILAFPRVEELMEEAMKMGADVVGGIPHLEPTYEDGVESLKSIFDLAQKHNALVDVHCDETDDEHSRFVDVMAAETTKRGMQGRVTVSHAVSMGCYPPAYMARLLPKLVASGVGFAIAPRENLQLQGRDFGPPTPRGIAPIRALVDLGILVDFCQDSICDPWYPIGDGNPLRNLESGMYVGHVLTAQYIDRCLDFITRNPAIHMGLRDCYGLDTGRPANFIVLGAKTAREALQCQLILCVC